MAGPAGARLGRGIPYTGHLWSGLEHSQKQTPSGSPSAWRGGSKGARAETATVPNAYGHGSLEITVVCGRPGNSGHEYIWVAHVWW